MTISSLRTILLCSLLFAGSAVRASPPDDLAEAQAAVINALVAGAEAHAPQLLGGARRNLQLARDSVARNEFEPARLFARHALADAAKAEAMSVAVRDAHQAPEAQTATR